MVQVAMRYKYKFMTQSQALLHGDLHSGSVMIGTDSVQVIDPEFSFMGPMAFDTGNYAGNLYMAWFSQPDTGRQRKRPRAISNGCYRR